MRVLLVGGAGYVGGLVLPVLRERHEVRVLDQRAEGIDHVTGDATDYATVRRGGRAACAEWDMSVNMLRLAYPTPDDAWPAWAKAEPPVRRRADDGTPIDATAGTDVARAILAALDHRDGCQAFIITGDRTAGLWSVEKARRGVGRGPPFPRAEQAETSHARP